MHSGLTLSLENLIIISTIFVILQEWIWHSYKWDILYPMILQPLLHLQIILVYLKRFAVCKTDKIIIPSARTNQDTRHLHRCPRMTDRPGVDKGDPFLFEVTIENVRFATF